MQTCSMEQPFPSRMGGVGVRRGSTCRHGPFVGHEYEPTAKLTDKHNAREWKAGAMYMYRLLSVKAGPNTPEA